MKSRIMRGKWLVIILGLFLILTACTSETTNDSSTADGSQTGSGNSVSKPINLKVATNNTQTSWYMFTSTLATILKENEPPINIEVLPYAGGTGNVDLIAQKEVDFALSFNVANKWAYEGTIAYDKKYPELRGLVGGINQYYIGIIARSDFLSEHNVTSIKDIKERKIPVRVITNPVGTLAEYNTRMVLDAYGLDYDTIESFGGSVELTSNDVIKNAFQNGTADLHILAMTKAHPVISEIAIQTDITVMGMEDEVRDWLTQYGYENITFPSNEFNKQDYDVNTVGFVATYITHEDLDEDVAYQITKAVNENKEALQKGHSSVADFDPQKAADPVLLGIPLHPGAERYYKEVGLLTEK